MDHFRISTRNGNSHVKPVILRLILICFVIWSVTTTFSIAQFDEANVLASSPDGSYYAISRVSEVQIFDSANGQLVNTLSGIDNRGVWGGVLVITWSPDSSRLAIANGTTVEIWQNPWNPVTLQLVSTFSLHSTGINTISWRPDGMQIASANAGSIYIWNPQNGNLIHQLPEAQLRVTHAMWSPDGQYFADASLRGVIAVWDATNWMYLDEYKVKYPGLSPPDNEPSINSIAWSPNSDRIAIASDDNLVRILDRATLTVLVRSDLYTRHTSRIWHIDWQPNGALIASASWDQTVRVWDSNTGALIDTFNSTLPLFSVNWSADGTTLSYIDALNQVENVTLNLDYDIRQD